MQEQQSRMHRARRPRRGLEGRLWTPWGSLRIRAASWVREEQGEQQGLSEEGLCASASATCSSEAEGVSPFASSWRGSRKSSGYLGLTQTVRIVTRLQFSCGGLLLLLFSLWDRFWILLASPLESSCSTWLSPRHGSRGWQTSLLSSLLAEALSPGSGAASADLRVWAVSWADEGPGTEQGFCLPEPVAFAASCAPGGAFGQCSLSCGCLRSSRGCWESICGTQEAWGGGGCLGTPQAQPCPITSLSFLPHCHPSGSAASGWARIWDSPSPPWASLWCFPAEVLRQLLPPEKGALGQWHPRALCPKNLPEVTVAFGHSRAPVSQRALERVSVTKGHPKTTEPPGAGCVQHRTAPLLPSEPLAGLILPLPHSPPETLTLDCWIPPDQDWLGLGALFLSKLWWEHLTEGIISTGVLCFNSALTLSCLKAVKSQSAYLMWPLEAYFTHPVWEHFGYKRENKLCLVNECLENSNISWLNNTESSKLNIQLLRQMMPF